MHIHRFFRHADARKRYLADLQRIVSAPTALELRPCVSCHQSCSKHRSTTCTCDCSPSCPAAPQNLSSDPDGYPIEQRVVELVYELASLRVTQPCWSCEGHEEAPGRVPRAPQVWFYADSVAFPDLISEDLHNLLFERRITHSWQVSVCPHSDKPGEITFSVRAEPETPARLDSLQRDLAIIGEGFAERIRHRAQSNILKLQVETQ